MKKSTIGIIILIFIVALIVFYRWGQDKLQVWERQDRIREDRIGILQGHISDQYGAIAVFSYQSGISSFVDGKTLAQVLASVCSDTNLLQCNVTGKPFQWQKYNDGQDETVLIYCPALHYSYDGNPVTTGVIINFVRREAKHVMIRQYSGAITLANVIDEPIMKQEIANDSWTVEQLRLNYSVR